MYKYICVVVLCGFIGSFIQYGTEKEGIGETKSGEPCRIVEKWGDARLVDAHYVDMRTKQFLQRNLEAMTRVDSSEVEYDCFLDIDTQEYALQDYQKMENLTGYTEIFVFKNRNQSAKCSHFEFNIHCDYRYLRTNVDCYGSGECIENKNVKREISIMGQLGKIVVFILAAIVICFSVIVLGVFWHQIFIELNQNQNN